MYGEWNGPAQSMVWEWARVYGLGMRPGAGRVWEQGQGTYLSNITVNVVLDPISATYNIVLLSKFF